MFVTLRKAGIRLEWSWLGPWIDLSRPVKKDRWKDKMDTGRSQVKQETKNKLQDIQMRKKMS